MRHAIVVWLVLGVTACGGDDLRERLAADGVYSPARSSGGRTAIPELGQFLFFDRELSGNRNIACSSCHMPFDHASDLHALGLGQGATGVGFARHGGTVLPRNTPSPFNRSFADALFSDGRVEYLDDGSVQAPVALPDGVETALEAQALLPLLDRDEMRGYDGDLDDLGAPNELAALADDAPGPIWDAIMTRLMAIPEYQERFARAFPSTPAGEHTIVHVARSIAAFEMRLWELTDTAFDAYLGAEHRVPEDDALSDDQLKGAELFFGDAGCDRCHSGPLLSDFGYHNIGVPPFGPGKRDGIDEGRFLVTGDPADRFAFRTPPLRNVELTAPYMHDGTAATLEEAILQHIDPESRLDGSVTGPDGTPVAVDPTLADAIRATLDPDTRSLRTLSAPEIGQLIEFLRSLSSASELGIFPGAGEPMVVPSGLPIDNTF